MSIFNSQELKTQMEKLVASRQNIEKGRDISGSMVNLNKTMNKMAPLLKNQQSYIKNFFSQQQHTGTQSKQSENRRYANRIFEITLNEITELFGAGKDFFTLEFKNNWDKIQNAFQKDLTTEREEVQQKNVIQFLFKIINLKDYIISKFMKSFLYRKCLLWKDLNIVNEGYVHSEKKDTTKLIEDYISNRDYAPTKPIYEWEGFELKGTWTMNKLQQPQFSLPTMLKIINEEIQQVFNVFKNYANLTVEQRNHEDIKRNTAIEKSLRQEIQDLKITYMQLQKKHRDAIVKDEKVDLQKMKEEWEKSQQQLQQKRSELNKLKFQFRDSSNQINSLKEKVKELETDLNRINNAEMKKLKELEIVQINLLDQFSRIHKKISNFGAMFEFESDGKKSLARQIIKLEQRIEAMATALGKEKIKNLQHKKQITRLNQIILELGAKLREEDG